MEPLGMSFAATVEGSPINELYGRLLGLHVSDSCLGFNGCYIPVVSIVVPFWGYLIGS